MITVVLIDDHKMVRQGIRMLLEDEPDIRVVGDAGTGEDGVELVKQIKPDVLITDLILNGMNGLEVARRVRKQVPGTKVIILTMYDDDAYIQQALREGAKGYILKGAGIEDLVQAVRAVMAGGTYFSPSVARKVR